MQTLEEDAAPVFLLCTEDMNSCSDAIVAAVSTLLRLGSGVNLCLKNQREFGSPLGRVLAQMDREQTDFKPHGSTGRKQ